MTYNNIGRPTIYTPELRDEICRRLASGRTMRSVCRDDDMPDRNTVYGWLSQNKGEIKEGETVVEEGFFYHHNRAREIGLDETCDETIEIADDGTNDYMEVKTKKGDTKIIFDKEAVMRSRLRVDARLAYLTNMAPRKYGKNRVEVQALDKKGNPADQAAARHCPPWMEVIYGKE